jgi:hypothetical protein
MGKINNRRPMKPTLDKLKVGQCSIFPIAKWDSLRALSSKMKREEDKLFVVNRRPNTVVVTRKN